MPIRLPNQPERTPRGVEGKEKWIEWLRELQLWFYDLREFEQEVVQTCEEILDKGWEISEKQEAILKRAYERITESHPQRGRSRRYE